MMIDFSRMKSVFKNDVIEFFCHPDLYNIIEPPVPAYKKLPEWYRTLHPYVPEESEAKDTWGGRGFTAKKCMPMLDCMSLGYIIPLAGDLHIKTNEDCTIVEHSSPPNLNLLDYHHVDQVGSKNPAFPTQPIKFLNYWIIRTAPGWSTLFTPPFNHMNKDFTCLSGYVDTDTYYKEVNLPAIWHTPNYDDFVPIGTPLIQVIPVRRSDIPRKPKVREMTPKEFKYIDDTTKRQNLQRGYYTDKLREPRK